MTTVAKRSLVGSALTPLPNGSELLLLSDYPQPVTVTINGTSESVAMTVMGADAPAELTVTQAGYYAHHLVSGLPQSNTYYEYQLSQTGTAIGDISFDGGLSSAPAAGDDFALILYSCNGGSSNDEGEVGAWNFVKEYAEKNALVNPNGLNLTAIHGVDDTVYADSITLDDTANTGHRLYDAGSGEAGAYTEYDACVRWMVAAGMVVTNTGIRVSSYKEKTRIWCSDKRNHVKLWGDHECFNDVAYGANDGTARLAGALGSAWQTVELFNYCAEANRIFNTGSHRSMLDATSAGFSVEYGNFQFIGLDRNYGDGSNREGNGAFLFSDAQITGAKAAINGSSARFRIIGTASQYHDSAVADIFTMDYNAVVEIFINDVDSLMAKHVSDGSKWLMFQGDNHSTRVTRHNKNNGIGTIQEQHYLINCGLMSRPNSIEIGGDVSTADPAKGWYDWAAADFLPPAGIGVNPEWRRVWDYSVMPDYPRTSADYEAKKRAHCLLVEVYDSETPMRVVVRGVNNSLGTDFEFTYLDDGGDNLPSDITKMSVR